LEGFDVRVKSVFYAALLMVFGTSVALGAGGPMAGKTVKVGVIADVTGSAGAYGTSQKNAYLLAAEDLKAGLIDAGGANLALNVEDSASDPAQVVNLVQKFTTDGTALMIGPTLSSEAKKADPIAVERKLTIMATSNTAQGITTMGPCVWRDSLSEEQVVPQMLAAMKKSWKSVKTAAIIYGDDDQFTKTDYEIFNASLKADNIDVVNVETFHKGDVDFKAQLTKINEKKPELLVIGALVEEAVKIATQAKQLGFKGHLTGGNGLNSPKFIENAGPAGDGVIVGAAYYVGSKEHGNPGFVERYSKKFGKQPDQFAAQAYAAAQIIAAAIKGGATNSGQFCSFFGNMKPLSTVIGPVSFQTSRDVRAESSILEVSKGAFVPFK
jgi:branched-chain amino acid transport system substrate-binding protein